MAESGSRGAHEGYAAPRALSTQRLYSRTRPNGLVLFDNVLWFGQVLAPDSADPNACAIQQLNDFLVGDPRVEVVMLPIAAGLTLCRKRAAA